ncbi:DNA-binding ferritin-like protein (Dps family) [Bacillus thuringiensis]
MNAQDMIELNNKKRELLTSENEIAYGDMLVYLRLSNVPEHQVEELLLEILDHLIEAQAENKNAYDIFGNDLQSYCDELIAALPAQTKLEKTSLIGFVISLLLAIQFGMDTLASLFIFLFEKDTDIISPPFSIPGTTLSISLIVLGILLILYLLKRYSFNKKINWKKRILFGFAFATPFCSAIFVNIYFRKQPYFIYHLTFCQNALIAILFFILYKLLYKKSNF